ncbi:hypothetical protein CFO_g3229 [Ceratocystis platani]|uniref:C2H2-type domain-containing protein n=1 Tax=Ceratocystis fimbriata f. sp. platani TaxID=88771 RepID=A0A0F8B0F2_CERFI|nr:hypothetical protein CFO_g3229 [Ceratocystis platani]
MSTSSRNGYDSPMDEHDMQRMNLFDRDRVGSKRRATSPPEIEQPLPPAPHQVEMTIEELHAHEAEKQYECQYCHNRFKNKNEAERHQNSLHVRRHSWSCKALDNFNKAFHENLASNGTLDICGYCGKDFERRGFYKADGVSRDISEQDREERIHHLQTAHKFRECNSSKKFFRADHFRQHLKHSHSGTSGKWTNQLENACMRDEPPLM